MRKSWKTFWLVLTSILNIIGNVATAGEIYSEEFRKDAEFGSEKAEQKREAKRAKWQAKNAP